MFSGIVEAVEPIIAAVPLPGAVRIVVKKPQFFDDLQNGDSIACNGVCLTVESFNDNTIGFALAAETIRVLRGRLDFSGLDEAQLAQSLVGQKLNLERSLKLGDRIHGHLVSGHVDSMAQLLSKQYSGESLILSFKVSQSVRPYIWNKGSVTLNGVSLTINELNQDLLSVCLIPETIKRTNLSILEINDQVTVEPDYMAKVAENLLINRGQNAIQQN